ncbi:MAG: 2TM domain-containing protein [Acidimicrobiia bacterium]|nr:2TM domain-containing protein [Acidimicrobiia bacterium]MBT8193264.1 2TM domain-containing protein [Acidimicrobiia bacterium]NNF87680.1 2TM domain-containing protein [Acidimicrobiia bacterium]NNJ47408.1 2TM domain-containing protein [Acidimicrobiia bacterium]NNL13150.1 2TM domain-containing protein [Acidimicrobiia bacterium]
MSTSTRPQVPGGTPEDERREVAREYVQQLRVFYVHASVFVVGIVLIFVVNLVINVAAGVTGEWWAWWSVWPLLGWGLGVAIHGLVVRLARPKISASTWEQRQINKILSEDDAG